LQELFDSIYNSYKKLDGDKLAGTNISQTITSGSASKPDELALKDGSTDAATTESTGSQADLLDIRKAYELPSGINAPTEEIRCQCDDHYEKKEYDTVIGLPAKKVFELIFDKISPSQTTFLEKYHKKRGDTDLRFGPWKEEGVASREIRFTVPVNNPMGNLSYLFFSLHCLFND